MARRKETQKVKGKFSSLKAVRRVTSLLRKTGSSQEKPKKRRATSAHSQEKLNKWKKETMMQAVQEYRSSRMPGYKGKPVSLVTCILCVIFKVLY